MRVVETAGLIKNKTPIQIKNHRNKVGRSDIQKFLEQEQIMTVDHKNDEN